MKRTTVFLTDAHIRGLAEVAQTDVLGVATLIRIFITEGITRRKQAAKKLAALDAPVRRK
jgi:hypothetical protein